jgi:hypothetical protein
MAWDALRDRVFLFFAIFCTTSPAPLSAVRFIGWMRNGKGRGWIPGGIAYPVRSPLMLFVPTSHLFFAL